MEKFKLRKGDYFLFIGRFIPDKGLHLLLQAFEGLNTDKKLVLIGGAPNPSAYEQQIKNTKDERIIFPGYIYGEDVNVLITNAYSYIQPSLIEGLSPVILTVMGIGTPLICSDIRENLYITKENALTFESGDWSSLKSTLEFSLSHFDLIQEKAKLGKEDVTTRFNWESITFKYIQVMEKV